MAGRDAGRDRALAMEPTYLMAKLGIDNHMTWFANIEYAAKMRGCWEAVQEAVAADVEVALTTPGGIPPKAVLTATLTSTQATAEQRATAGLQLRALDWKKMDATALGLMHQNVTDMYYPAFRTHQTAHALWLHFPPPTGSSTAAPPTIWWGARQT